MYYTECSGSRVTEKAGTVWVLKCRLGYFTVRINHPVYKIWTEQ